MRFASVASLALLAFAQASGAQDPTRIALVSLCDPSKIATLKSDPLLASRYP